MITIGKFHQTIFDAKEAIIENEIKEAMKIIKSHIENEHGIDSDFSKVGMFIHAHRVYMERAHKYLELYKKEKEKGYREEAKKQLEQAEDLLLEIYQLVDKLRRDLIYEE